MDGWFIKKAIRARQKRTRPVHEPKFIDLSCSYLRHPYQIYSYLWQWHL